MTKAITLHQPWASLIALGVKTIETRSWKPPAALIGERLLIHAGQRDPRWGSVGTYRFDRDTDGVSIIWNDGEVDGDIELDPVVLHRGAIVASCVLADAVPMVQGPMSVLSSETEPRLWVDEHLVLTGGFKYRPGGADLDISGIDDQRPYGDFAPGRWAWLLDDVKPTTERCPACWGTGDRPTSGGVDCMTCGGSAECEPIPAQGHQRVWEWTP